MKPWADRARELVAALPHATSSQRDDLLRMREAIDSALAQFDRVTAPMNARRHRDAEGIARRPKAPRRASDWGSGEPNVLRRALAHLPALDLAAATRACRRWRKLFDKNCSSVAAAAILEDGHANTVYEHALDLIEKQGSSSLRAQRHENERAEQLAPVREKLLLWAELECKLGTQARNATRFLTRHLGDRAEQLALAHNNGRSTDRSATKFELLAVLRNAASDAGSKLEAAVLFDTDLDMDDYETEAAFDEATDAAWTIRKKNTLTALRVLDALGDLSKKHVPSLVECLASDDDELPDAALDVLESWYYAEARESMGALAELQPRLIQMITQPEGWRSDENALLGLTKLDRESFTAETCEAITDQLLRPDLLENVFDVVAHAPQKFGGRALLRLCELLGEACPRHHKDKWSNAACWCIRGGEFGEPSDWDNVESHEALQATSIIAKTLWHENEAFRKNALEVLCNFDCFLFRHAEASRHAASALATVASSSLTSAAEAAHAENIRASADVAAATSATHADQPTAEPTLEKVVLFSPKQRIEAAEALARFPAVDDSGGSRAGILLALAATDAGNRDRFLGLLATLPAAEVLPHHTAALSVYLTSWYEDSTRWSAIRALARCASVAAHIPALMMQLAPSPDGRDHDENIVCVAIKEIGRLHEESHNPEVGAIFLRLTNGASERITAAALAALARVYGADTLFPTDTDRRVAEEITKAITEHPAIAVGALARMSSALIAPHAELVMSSLYNAEKVSKKIHDNFVYCILCHLDVFACQVPALVRLLTSTEKDVSVQAVMMLKNVIDLIPYEKSALIDEIEMRTKTLTTSATLSRVTRHLANQVIGAITSRRAGGDVRTNHEGAWHT